jgi:hypothetical protein
MQISSLNNFNVIIVAVVVIDEVVGEIINVELDGEVDEGR